MGTVQPTAAAAEDDNFEQRTRRFFTFINAGDAEQLRALVNSLNAEEMTTLLQMGEPNANPSWSALLIAIHRRHTEIVAILLENGANPNETTRARVNIVVMNVTMLWIAVRKGIDICRLLVTHGANVNLGTDTAHTPLMIACRHRFMDIVTFLVENGADVNLADSGGFTPLMYASEGGEVGIVRLLLSHNAIVEQMDFNVSTFALMDASEHGHLEVCRVLVEEGSADVNQQAIDGTTPLMGASIRGHLSIVTFLIENGAEAEHIDIDGYNALMHAVYNKNTAVAQHLLTIGVSTDQVGVDGKRAMDLAMQSGLAEMLDIFRIDTEQRQNEQQQQQDEDEQQQQM